MKTTFFVYGTLLIEKTWKQLIDRLPVITPAVLHDFRRYKVLGAHYPGVWNSSGEKVQGGCVELTASEIEITDRYEGFAYRKDWVHVISGKEEIMAQVYLRQPVSEKEWNNPYTMPRIGDK